MRLPFALIFLIFVLPSVQAQKTGNVIFVHPDGAGISQWQAARFLLAGPDGDLHWDRLPHIAVYRGHPANCLTASSNAGGTMHAYGIKVPYDAFGTGSAGEVRPESQSGFAGSIMHEAISRGLRTGLVNSGSIIEPGTSAFVASVASRSAGSAEVTRQVVESGVDVILSGGEEWFLPEGRAGRHAASGKRNDGLDLVERARELGYAVVFTPEELADLPDETPKVLGIFAEAHTFNDLGEEKLRNENLPTYKQGTPTLAEMTEAALRFLRRPDGHFFLVVEEEGTDNFANVLNARGTLDALARADQALAVALAFQEKNPDTLVITAADSSAGAFDVLSLPAEKMERFTSLTNDPSGALYSRPHDAPFYLSAPDKAGQRHPFLIAWASTYDLSGGIVVRAMGLNADRVRGSFDNTQIFTLVHQTLFGDMVPGESAAR